MSLAAAAAGADGIIVEVHNEPDEAIGDGPQVIATERSAEYAEQLERSSRWPARSLDCPRPSTGPARPAPAHRLFRRRPDRRLGRAGRETTRRRRGQRLRPRPREPKRALEVGALDAVPDPSPRRWRARRWFCAAPVGALPELAREAIVVGDEDVVVPTSADQAGLLAGLERRSGAPSASSAATRSRVPRRRAWPTPARTSSTVPAVPEADRPLGGVQNDLLQRTVAGLGVRPQAIDADSHDRLTATVSHMPHAYANVLAEEAAAAGPRSRSGCPGRPSFRTRPGSPARTRRSGGHRRRERRCRRGRDRRGLGRLGTRAGRSEPGEGDAVSWWHWGARHHRRPLEADTEGGELHEIRVAVENRPGNRRRKSRSRSGTPASTRGHGPLPRSRPANGRDNPVAAGDAEAERVAEVISGESGHTASVLGAGT